MLGKYNDLGKKKAWIHTRHKQQLLVDCYEIKLLSGAEAMGTWVYIWV